MNQDINTYDPDAEIKRLRAERRKAIVNHRVEWDGPNTKRDDNGDLIQEKSLQSQRGHTETVERNLSQLLRPAVSTTSDVEILVIEAELAADGRTPSNPHVPSSKDVLQRAETNLESRGLTPAWEIDQ